MREDDDDEDDDEEDREPIEQKQRIRVDDRLGAEPPKTQEPDFADERSDNFITPPVHKPSVFEQLAVMSDKIPMAQTLDLRVRLLKLGLFSERVHEWIRREAKVKSPLDTIIFSIVFLFMAYLPTLIFTLVLSFFFPDEKKETYPRSLFVYNNPDQQEINSILKAVKVIQDNVTKL